MRLYTVQPLEVVEQLVKNGRFVCDIAKSWADDEDNPSYLESYDWLVERMIEKVGQAPRDVKYPVWAWYRHDMESLKYGSPCEVGKKCAIVTINVDDSRVVLSDFWRWEETAFLGIPYVNESEFEDNDVMAEYNRIEALGKEAVKETWNEVFNLNDEESPIQATLWEIRKEDVVSIEYFEVQETPDDDSDEDTELD